MNEPQDLPLGFDDKAAHNLALQRCDDLIQWYQKNAKSQRGFMARTRLVAVVLSGLVPVLLIAQISLPEQTTWWWLMCILIGLFPAGAAISSALNEVFQYKENWVRFSIA